METLHVHGTGPGVSFGFPCCWQARPHSLGPGAGADGVSAGTGGTEHWDISSTLQLTRREAGAGHSSFCLWYPHLCQEQRTSPSLRTFLVLASSVLAHSPVTPAEKWILQPRLLIRGQGSHPLAGTRVFKEAGAILPIWKRQPLRMRLTWHSSATQAGALWLGTQDAPLWGPESIGV